MSIPASLVLLATITLLVPCISLFVISTEPHFASSLRFGFCAFGSLRVPTFWPALPHPPTAKWPIIGRIFARLSVHTHLLVKRSVLLAGRSVMIVQTLSALDKGSALRHCCVDVVALSIVLRILVIVFLGYLHLQCDPIALIKLKKKN